MTDEIVISGVVLNPYEKLDADPPIEVQPKQDEFLNEGAKYKLMGGAQGGGKSRACRMEAFRCNEIIPRCKGLVLRRSRGEVVKNFVEPLLEETRIINEDGSSQPYLKWLSSKNRIVFPNGSIIDIGFCERDDHVEKYRGLEYDWICIEELTQWKFDWWKKIMTSLRTAKEGVRPFFFGSTNPGGIGHGWVKRLWINRNFEAEENSEDYAIVRATIYDNPALMRNDPEYVKLLMSLPEKERRARLDGDWDVFEGQFFNEYREKYHVVDTFYPTEGIKRRIIAFDYGYKKPSSVGWYALTNQGHVYRYRELYGPGMLYSDMARKIAAMTREDEKINYIVGDPAALGKKNESTGTSLEDEFLAVSKDLKLPWLSQVFPANNDRATGWSTVRKYLQIRRDPNTGIEFSPLHICRNGLNLIRTLPDQVHDKHNVEDLDSDGEDHAEDELRYALMDLGISIAITADVQTVNAALKKENALSGLSPKDKEMRERGIKSSKSILDKKF